MKKNVIHRYEINDKNQAVIDVSIKSIEHLFHDFDRTAPYHRKELDQEFADYLTECVQELGKNPFIIQISLEKMPDKILTDRIRKSVNSYYAYLKDIENRSMRKMFKRFIILISLGLILLFFAILATRNLSLHKGVIAEVFAQGLTIAAWVSLWEALVNIFFEWYPHRENIQLYTRVIEAEIVFRHLTQ